MVPLKLVYLRSAAELRAAAPQWDELWHRSEVAAPTARAETIAHWLERFAPQSPFCALAVQRNLDFVAALPLVSRGSPLWRVGRLPWNAWGLCGDLLLDPEIDLDAALDLLLDGVKGLGWPLLSLAPVAYESDRWRLLQADLQRRSLCTHIQPMDHVGQVAMQPIWSAYQALWSGNHRRQLRKARKRASLSGELTLEVHREFLPSQLERLLRLGCEIEDLSWKGPSGTSILRSPGMFDWYLGQARHLAVWGQLQLTFLRHQRNAIAFEYGYWAKGTYYSAKVGYDPAYAQFSPGQVLRAMLFERFHSDGETTLVDFWGPLTKATARWCTQIYPVGRVLIAPGPVASRVALPCLAALHRLRVQGSGFRTLIPSLLVRADRSRCTKVLNPEP